MTTAIWKWPSNVLKPCGQRFRNAWRGSKFLTLLGLFIGGCILFFLYQGLIQWCLANLFWFLSPGNDSLSHHRYIMAIALVVAVFALGLILSRLFDKGFRQKIAIPLQQWISPEFPMRGIVTAVFLGWFLAMLGVVNLPSMLATFGWLQGEKVTAIPFVATISALAVAPVTILVWYWRHVYKKREREHELLTLATKNLADANSPSIRITGLYTLQELVTANPARLIDVMNILCGFLKHRYCDEEERYRAEKNSDELPKIDFGRSPDIREALNLFSKIWQSRFDNEEKYRIAMEFASKNELENYRPDLQEINFQQSDLSDLCLRQVNLTNAKLQGTELWNAKLQGARLWNAKLQKADICEANLQGASLEGANLQEAGLCWANLQGAVLCEASLQGADLSGIDLQGGELCEANLQGARLRWASLQGADLRWANLQGVYLYDAKVDGADFALTRLHGVTDQYIHDFSLAKLVEEEKCISSEMRNKTYTAKEIQPTIDQLKDIATETSDRKLRETIGQAISRLQDGIDKPQRFPDPDDPEYCGKLTLETALNILKTWSKEMQWEQLKILKERGFDVPYCF